MKKRFWNMGLSKKFMVLILVCLILPLILVFVVMNSVITRQFLKKQYEKELEILKQSRPTLENVLEDAQIFSRNIAVSKETQALFKEFQEKGEVSEENLRNATINIEHQVYTKRHISSISLYSGETTLYQYGNYYEKEDIFEQNEQKTKLEALKGKAMWTPARIHTGYIGGRGNEAVVSLYRSVNHLYRINSNIGGLRISLSEDYLASLYGSVREEGDLVYIYDGSGEIVSSVNKEMLGKKVEERIRVKASRSEGYFVDSGESVVFYYKLPINEWMVVQVREVALLKRQINMISAIFWAALFLSILFGVIFSVWQKRAVINPIVKLAQDVEAVNEESYCIHLHSKSRDEVGTLNRSIIHMTERIQCLIETVYKGQIQCQEAEILSLQSQINPHFLYNTLDTMRWIALGHQEEDLAGQIEALSGMFRHVLNNGQELTTVKEEIKYLKNYLAIQESRFGEKIQVELQVDASLYDCQVLKLILQPLVENAFVHGLEEKVGGGHIWISVTEEGGDILYVVHDDGIGADEEKVKKILTMKTPADKIYALKNVNERIKLQYGDAYGVRFSSGINKGATVHVRIAKCTGRDKHESVDRG